MASQGVTRRELLLGLGLVAVSATGCSSGRETRAPQGRGPVVTPTGPTSGPTTGPSTDVGPTPAETGRGVGGPAGPPRWPGHRPGRAYLGLSYPDDIAAAEAVLGHVGVHRSYFDWEDLERETEVIDDDHANRRLPWVSFKPPGGASGWERVAGGEVDDHLRRRARHYARHSDPVVVTFHHEPSNDRPGDGREFAAAWVRVHDVMHAETHLRHVALVPILGEWEFNPNNEHADPDQWLTPNVLDRAAFLGLDVYQNGSGQTYDERLGRVLDWLAARGYPDLMLGVGETGCTDTFGSPSAAQWWSDSWRWVETSTDRVGVVAYFDSERNSRRHVYWPLDESEEKRRAFEQSLESPTACRLAT